MILRRVIPPETEEYLYNYSYIPSPTEEFFQDVSMKHFVYPTGKPSKLKELVLIWEAVFKTEDKRIDILTFKFECCYLLECEDLNEESLERLKNLIDMSAKLFAENYEHISLTHLVRFNDLNTHCVFMNKVAEEILPLLFF